MPDMEDNIQRNRIETDSAKSGRKIFWIRGIFLAVTLSWMIVIFSFSAQPADDSGATSQGVGAFLAELFVPGYGDWSTQRQEAFVEKMNQRAAELGMADTHFCNATGLPAEGHVTSAYDIALMSRELIRNHPDIRQYTTIWMDSLRDGASSLVNTNRLIRFYEGATGLKTGSTDSALYCLSGTAERDGMELIAVIMKAPTSTQRFNDATALLNYGFSTYTLETVGPETALPPVPVSLGTQATVQPVLGEDTHLLLEKAKAGDLQQTVSLAEAVEAPVVLGSQLGTLTVTSGEEVVAELPILAGEEIPRITFVQMLVRMLQTAFLAD